MTNPSDFLKANSGDRHPAVKFENVGDTISGVISEEPRVVPTTNMNSGALEDKLVVAITRDDGQTFALWVKGGFLAGAIWKACEAAGVDGLAVGGRLGVRYSGTKDTGKPQPAKLYEAEYAPPAVGGSILSAGTTPAASEPSPTASLI